MGKQKNIASLEEQYRTGQTKPSKSYGGAIAVLLILVIFLSGIVSILSMMNIQLLRTVKNTNTENIPMLDHASRHSPHTASEAQPDSTHWGMTCYSVTDFHARYYDLPKGIYISHVEKDCHFAKEGIQSGDIITHLNDTAVCTPQTLKEMMNALRGEKAVFTLMRQNKPVTLTITLHEELYGNDLS